jgi:hypothetical protein
MPVRVRRAFAARVEPAMRIANVVPEETPATRAAREVVAEYSSPALVNHGERSYLWSAALGELAGMAYDRELLFVASMVHDLGLVLAFDNHLAPFEDAGGDVGWVFAAGAGWPQESRARVKRSSFAICGTRSIPRSTPRAIFSAKAPAWTSLAASPIRCPARRR